MGNLFCGFWRMPVPHSFIRSYIAYVCVREPRLPDRFYCSPRIFCMLVLCQCECITPSSGYARLVTHAACKGMKRNENPRCRTEWKTQSTETNEHIDADQQIIFNVKLKRQQPLGVHRFVAIDVTFSTLRQLIAIGARSFFALV